MRFFCTLLFFILLPLNLFSQQSFFVDQTYDGITYAPFSLSDVTNIKQIDAQTILIRRSGKEYYIQINKGEILQIHKEQQSNNGMYLTKYELKGFTVQVPVNANAKDENQEFFTIQYQTHINNYYPREKMCLEVHFFDKQGKMYKWNLERPLKIAEDSIDKSKPVTVHYIKHNGSEYKITWTRINNYNVMYNTLPPDGEGNQLNKDQIYQLLQASRDKHDYYFSFNYIDDRKDEHTNTLYFNPYNFNPYKK